jgi:hypothetical protein
MPRHVLRLVCALVIVSLAQIPCFAQAPPPDQAAAAEAPPPGEFCWPTSFSDAWDQIWASLGETPATRHTYGNPYGPAQFISPSYRVMWFPEAGVAGQNANLSAVRQDFHLNCPVWKDECQMVGLTTSVRNVMYSTHAVLPGATEEFPETLWDVRFGVNYAYKFANGWSAGASVNFGSASDRPFASVNELTLGFMGFLRIPVGEHNAWLFSLAYSPTGELNFPLPGVAFYWQPSDSFNATIGIPFRVMWRPVEDVTLEASYMPVTNVKAKATWRIWGGVSVYAAYDANNESYFLADRADENDRFFAYDQRVTGGVKLEFGRHCAVDFSSGYAFDRFFFEGHTRNDQNNHRVDVGDSPFLGLLVEVRW